MTRNRFAIVAVFVLVAAVGDLRGNSVHSSPLHILGEVSASAVPVDDALVIAFGLTSLQAVQTHTDESGFFQLLRLPAGVYRVIAVKQGFLPAVATVIPSATAPSRLNLRMRKGRVTPESASQVWEIRRSLPSDILRELDAAITPEPETADGSRLRGAMTSVAGVAEAEDSQAFAQTAVELRGQLPTGWTVDIAGQMHQVESSMVESFSSRSGEASGIAMSLHTSPGQSLRIASNRSWWKVDDAMIGDEVDMQSHVFEWNRSDSNVEVRYQSQQNLFRRSDLDGEMLEISGMKQLYSSPRTDFAVNVRLQQENARELEGGHPIYRSTHLAANGRVAVGERVNLLYGLKTRVSNSAQEWSPESGAEIRLSDKTALVVSGLYKVRATTSPVDDLPRVVSYDQAGSVMPRYRYSLGVVNANKDGTGLRALLTVASIDSMVSLLFDDFVSPMWEGYYLGSGDIHQDITLTYRGRVGKRLYFDVETTAGRTENRAVTAGSPRHFITGNVRSLYSPSGTSLEVTYRVIDQPQGEFSILETAGERLNLRVGQSLHLPVDLRLLVGVDLVRQAEDPSPAAMTRDDVQRRFVGGLSFAF